MLPDGHGEPARWTLVLPLKGGDAAKSRLGAGPALARAIALDCLDAVIACPDTAQVLVVTADPVLAADAVQAGALTVPEARPGSGLVAAVQDGLAAAVALTSRPVAVLLGDLPALRPLDLSAGLAAAGAVLAAHPAAPMAALPDAEGTGTVLLAGRSARSIAPAFGPGSLAGHVRLGAVAIRLDGPGPGTDAFRAYPGADAVRLRHDVDTPADLSIALALGTGPRTAAALAPTPS